MMAAANHTSIECHHTFGFHSVTGLTVASTYPNNAKPAMSVNRWRAFEPYTARNRSSAVRTSARPEIDGGDPLGVVHAR